jgi:hypothetical protein
MAHPQLSLLLITILLPACLLAQNLVPNGNFDSVNICTEYKAPCCPSGWFFTARPRNGGKFDYNGHFINMLTVDKGRASRQYWQTCLLCPLRSGAHYRIRLKVAATNIGPNLHDIGFWLTDHFIISQGDSLLQPEKYLGFMDARVQKLKNGWFSLEKEMTAADNSPILIIGNFAPESNQHIAGKRGINGADIMVSDLSIEPLDGSLCPHWKQVRDSLFAIHRRHSDSAHPAPLKEDTATAITPKPTRIDTLRIPDIDFEFNSYHLTDSMILEPHRPLLENKDISHILVAGYTDDKGTEAYNLNLSQQRAQEVARMLTRQFGLPGELITTEGRGISHQYKNDAANRRVEIYLYH